MISFQISNLREFTSLLYLNTLFDPFLFMEGTFRTAGLITLDGRRSRDFYSPEEYELLPEKSYLTWQEIRPLCYQIIRGRRLPVSFRLILIYPESPAGQKYLLNLRYENGHLNGITGVSYQEFTLTREGEARWDEIVLQFLKENRIDYDLL